MFCFKYNIYLIVMGRFCFKGGVCVSYVVYDNIYAICSTYLLLVSSVVPEK